MEKNGTDWKCTNDDIDVRTFRKNDRLANTYVFCLFLTRAKGDHLYVTMKNALSLFDNIKEQICILRVRSVDCAKQENSKSEDVTFIINFVCTQA